MDQQQPESERLGGFPQDLRNLTRAQYLGRATLPMTQPLGSSGPMSPQDKFPPGEDLERFRNYVRLLVRMQLRSQPGARIDASGMETQNGAGSFSAEPRRDGFVFGSLGRQEVCHASQ